MNQKLYTAFLLAGCLAPSASAQTPEVKAKAPIYLYISVFTVPRASWAAWDKSTPEDNKLMERGLADGTVIFFGDDQNLVHQPDGYTHDNWFGSTSIAGLMKMLDQEMKATSQSQSGAILTATKHSDSVRVSRFYNWKSGSYKGAYTFGMSYKLKADAPDDALEMLSKTAVVPLLEKLLADGSIVEYDIETPFIHTEAPGMFSVFIIAPNAEGIDKFRAAEQETVKANSLMGPAFNSMTDDTGHRDELSRTNVTFK